MLVLGILYMLVMRFMLKGDTQTPQREGWTRRTFRDLIREYRLTGRARRLAIRRFANDWSTAGRSQIT